MELNPNVNDLFTTAVVDAMQGEVYTPNQQVAAICEALNLTVSASHGAQAMLDMLCDEGTVDEIAQRIVLRFVQGRNRLSAWEALGYETRYAGNGNNLLMSGQSALETVFVG